MGSRGIERWGLAAAVLLAAGITFAAEGDSLNRVVNGSFETGFLSLSLPAVDYFPWVVGGWAARGTPTAQVIDDPELAFDGRHALRLTSTSQEPVHILQDLPLSTNAYELELAFYPELGTQAVRLYSAWDRRLPSGGRLAVAVVLAEGGLEVATPAGRWRVVQMIDSGQWHLLRVAFDPRTGVQTVGVDHRTVLSLPGLPESSPQTLMIGDAEAGQQSSYRYDSIRLVQLPEAELAALRLHARSILGETSLARLLVRLDAARAAFSRGAPRIALPELRAARRLLEPSNGPGAQLANEADPSTAKLRQELEDLIRLLSLSITGSR